MFIKFPDTARRALQGWCTRWTILLSGQKGQWCFQSTRKVPREIWTSWNSWVGGKELPNRDECAEERWEATEGLLGDSQLFCSLPWTWMGLCFSSGQPHRAESLPQPPECRYQRHCGRDGAYGPPGQSAERPELESSQSLHGKGIRQPGRIKIPTISVFSTVVIPDSQRCSHQKESSSYLLTVICCMFFRCRFCVG